MNKIILNEESQEFFAIKEKWFSTAKDIRTKQQLVTFIDHLLNDYEHDYGTVVHAIAAIAVGAASLGASEEGITGFQASCVMWDFIKEWRFYNNKAGLTLIDYDLMLYPQYAYRFAKKISKSTWKSIQEQAKENLKDTKLACEDVIEHWKSIADGQVPFGYEVEDDE